MDLAPEVDPFLLHVSVMFVSRLLVFQFIFQSKPRVFVFQMQIVILSKYMESDWYQNSFTGTPKLLVVSDFRHVL